MKTLYDDNGKPLPDDVQKRVSDFIDSLKNVPWFSPSPGLKKEDVEKQANFTLECFGVKASLEFRILKKEEYFDAVWDAAWDTVWDAAWDTARDAARDAAREAAREAVWDAAWDAAREAAREAVWDAAWDAAWGAAWGAAWDAARDAARDAAEILVLDKIKDKYPNGAFIQLFKLWEMGLYPVGVINGKFVIYVPPSEAETYFLTKER